MTKRRMTVEEWQEVRARWEADPRDGYTWVVREMNLSVSDVSVFKRARKETWAKKASLKTIVERAQSKADEQGSQRVSGDRLPLTNSVAVDLRANVIDKHRQEWQEHREQFALESIVAIDPETSKTTVSDGGEKLARVAKTVAETIKTRQQGERDAWGLNAIAVDTSGGVANLDELDAMFARAVQRAEEMKAAVRKERATDAAD